jgi:hypothetical protein
MIASSHWLVKQKIPGFQGFLQFLIQSEATDGFEPSNEGFAGPEPSVTDPLSHFSQRQTTSMRVALFFW